MSNLPSVPFNTPLTDKHSNGMLSMVWSGWFVAAFQRMGGAQAPTNNDLITSSRFAAGAVNNAALGASAVQPANVASPFGLVPTGSLLPYGGASAPTGYLFCDGSAVSRITYAALFTAIGTAYGVGDGTTTFNIPNTQGLFPRGAGSQTISGVTYASTLGATVQDQMQGHFHSLSASAAAHTATSNAATTGAAASASASTVTVGSPSSDGTNGTPRTGTETRPANFSVNWIVKI